VHLVGFTIGIYYDARTYKCKKWQHVINMKNASSLEMITTDRQLSHC